MSKNKFLKLCKKNNVVFTDNGNCLKIDAPDGHHFTASGLHWRDIYTFHGEWKRPDMYAELANELSMGVEVCDSECEV